MIISMKNYPVELPMSLSSINRGFGQQLDGSACKLFFSTGHWPCIASGWPQHLAGREQ